MNINEAAQTVAEEIMKTGHPTSATVRRLFVSLRLPMDEIEILAMDALSQRVNSLLTSGTLTPPVKRMEIPHIFERPDAAVPGQVNRTATLPPPIKISVDVEVLHNTLFEVHGIRKPIVEFAIRDLDYMLSLYHSEIVGYSARSEVFEYAKSRLKTLKKSRISELASGEQTILARKWKATAKLAESSAVG